jgi:hypothetical protein
MYLSHPSRLYMANRKPMVIRNIPRRIKYKKYKILIMNKDSFVNNRIKLIN